MKRNVPADGPSRTRLPLLAKRHGTWRIASLADELLNYRGARQLLEALGTTVHFAA